jgi:ERCC4-type nuclease
MPKFDYSKDIVAFEENTRNTGQPIIIVDKREFRSLLPAKLFFAGFKIIPVFLEIGDYILTDGYYLLLNKSFFFIYHKFKFNFCIFIQILWLKENVS